jgi:predicted amidohydrolase YtcJ
MSLYGIYFKSSTIKLMAVCLLMIISCSGFNTYQPDLIFYNAKILTVDDKFSIVEALAIKDEKLMALGTNHEITQLAGNSTIKIDLPGKTILARLIDAHLHPETASVSELDHIIPDVHTLDELLDWIKKEAAVKKKGDWIKIPLKMRFL